MPPTAAEIMESLVVLYRILGEPERSLSNAFLLSVEAGHSVWYFDVLNALNASGVGCKFSVLALVSKSGFDEC